MAIEVTRGVKQFLRSSAIARKIIELIIASLSLGLALDAVANGAIPEWKTMGVTYVTICSYIIINGVALLSLFSGQNLPDIALIAFAAAGGMLFVLSGQETLSVWVHEDNYKSKEHATPPMAWIIGMHQVRLCGLLCMLVAGFYILDAIVTVITKDKEKVKEARPLSESDASLYSSRTTIPERYRFRKPYSLYTCRPTSRRFSETLKSNKVPSQ